MSTDRDVTRIVRSWMRTEEHESADRVLDAVLDALDTTPQRRTTWWARRFPEMNTTAKIVLASAAVVVAAILGYNYLIAPNVGDRQLPASTPSPSPAADVNRAEGALDPGSYSVTRPDYLVTFTVPEGWVKNVVPSVVWTDNSEARVGFEELTSLNADPCQPDLGLLEPVVGPTVDDLATALAAMPGMEAVRSDVTISGFEGVRVEITAPPEFSSCVDGGALLNTESPLEPGQHTFWILDVDGTRVVIRGVARTRATEAQAAEVEAIVDSVRIETR